MATIADEANVGAGTIYRYFDGKEDLIHQLYAEARREAHRSILNTMQTYYGSRYVADFNRFGKQYRVCVQAEPEDRASAQSLQRMFVKNERGEMGPSNSFVLLDRVYGTQNISRINLFKSVQITGGTTPGYSSGDAIAAIKEVVDEQVSPDYGYAFSGLSREENQSSGQELHIFLICLIFVYFLLSAQYESYIAPWAVILPLSIGLAGAYGFANLFGIANNVYLQIAAIMLMGLLAKNAVLIVDFALVRRRKRGMSIAKAALNGAEERFRPILMTSFAFIAGLLPLAVATGVNANANQAIGILTAGGMFVGTLIGLFVVPVLFILLQRLQESISGVPEAARSSVPALEQAITEQEHAISLLLGRPPGPVDRTTLDAQSPLDSLATGVPAQLLRNRPDVIAAEYRYRSAFERTNSARAAFYPSLTLTAEGGVESLTAGDLLVPGSLFYNLIGGLTQPLFANGRNEARLERSKARQQQARIDLRRTLFTAGSEVMNALGRYQNTTRRIEARRRQLDALDSAVTESRELLRYGEETYLQVLTAQQEYLAAQLDNVNDRLDRLQAGVALYRALGGGWDRSENPIGEDGGEPSDAKRR